MASRTFAIIPARSQSTRFPNKILAPILGQPMIQHVWMAAQEAQKLTAVVIATDDAEIARVASGFGADVVRTPSHFRSGSERVAYVAEKLSCDYVVGLQGDEPLIAGGDIDALVEALEKGAPMVTLAEPSREVSDLNDPNVVKVVVDSEGRALYFSRRALQSDAEGGFLKHVGIYGFRRSTLLQLQKMPPASLELAENLEQLRALEGGVPIHVVPTRNPAIGVDVPEDIKKVESYLRSPANSVILSEFQRKSLEGVLS